MQNKGVGIRDKIKLTFEWKKDLGIWKKTGKLKNSQSQIRE